MKYPKDFYTSARKKKPNSKKLSKSEPAKSPVTAQRIVANLPGESSYCDQVSSGVDNYLARKCEEKANAMSPVDEAGACPCSGDGSGGGSASGGVDLVVLIDSSGSMHSIANAISSAASDAFETAKERCEANANVTYLYLDQTYIGSDPNSNSFVGIFNTSHERHLIDNAGASGPFFGDSDNLPGHEQGGEAIADIAKFNNWTPGNCRAILYISDERLDSSGRNGQPSQGSLDSANLAIAEANTNNVTIFSHFVDGTSGSTITSPNPQRADIASHYQAMSNQTGGHAQIDMTPTSITKELYVEIISRAICEGCGNSEASCTTAELPELEPCVSISWGDSECDCMEGDDHEEICISICNCYDNVTFQNVKIAGIVITDENGRRPPSLPDGSPSSELYSFGPYCFGDIDPCKDGEKSCVSRNAMIINRGLPPGTWKVRVVGLCFDVIHHYDERIQEFSFEVCKN